MRSRRVVITGIGIICAIGKSYEEFTRSLRNGRCGTDRITAFDVSGLNSVYGCEVKDYSPLDHFGRRELRRMDRGSQFALIAARQALQSSGIVTADLDAAKCGVVLGTTLGGFVSGMEYYRRWQAKRLSLGFLLDYPLYSAGARICVETGFTGFNMVFSTACSSSGVALGHAFDLIRNGTADMIIAGGFDTMAEITCSGFGVLRNVSPDICRPFDKNRKGIILGEGAACVVMEEESLHRRRGGPCHAEFLGYGMSSDAYHMTAPDITGRGPTACMEQALAKAGVQADGVDYINAHGTGTIHNDMIESLAIKRCFGPRAYLIPVSSTKSMHGHTLGAAGAIEAVCAIAAMEGNFIPPTINYSTPDPSCDLDYVPNEARDGQANVVLSNTFGFGGNNCSTLWGRYVE
ncbi:MAG: 3-oxoacyl-(acyl-carrier-protein) synthase 2 [Syntrophorhabdus sp. PtaB.Bin184]|nr:MAG: 3-oxoacyl-(acyl-carrier-protein) synthase 2 [Syntrophorhabdus sp. PtaB.Bin184]